MALPWEEYQGKTEVLPWEEYQSAASPTPLPTPKDESEEKPWTLYERVKNAAIEYGKGIVPTSFEGLAHAANIPTDLTDPSQVIPAIVPGSKPAFDMAHQAYARFNQIQAADETPAYSQERFNAGIGTALDVLGLASMGGIGKMASGGESAAIRGPFTPATEMPGPRGFTAVASDRPINLPETPEIAPTFQGLSPEADIPYMPPAKPYEYVPPADTGAGGSTSMFPLSGGNLLHQIKPLIDERGAFTRGGDHIRSLMEKAPNDQLVDFIRWSKTSSPYVERFGGGYAADVLRQRGVPVDEIAWQQQNTQQPFNLGGVMTDAELAAEQAAIEKANAALAEEAARKARVQHGWQQKLTGDSGDVTQTEIGATKPDETLFNRDLTHELSPEEQRQAQREYEAELLADTEEHLTRGGDEFLDWLKREGLPTKGSKYDSPELNSLREMFESTKTRGLSGKGKGKARYGKGQAINNSGEKINYKDIFHNAEEHLDSLTQRAKRSGFPVESIDDFLNLVQDRLFNGKKFFGDEFMGEELERQSFGRGRIERGGSEGSVPNRPFQKHQRILNEGAAWGSGRYKATYQINKVAGDKVNALAAAKDVGEFIANTEWRKVVGSLSEQEINDLDRYLTSERLKEVYARHIREGEIAPWVKHDLQLDPIESARIARNPNIARAIHRFAPFAKMLEDLRLKSGLSMDAILGKNRSKFVSLYPVEDAETMSVVHTPSGTVPLQFKSKTTAAANMARGFADNYITDLKEIMIRGMTEVLPKVRLRELYQHLDKEGLVSSTPVKELRGHKVVPYDMGAGQEGELSKAIPPKVWLPGPIADAITDVMVTPPSVHNPFAKYWEKGMNLTTGFALTANPAELFNHMHRQLAIVSTMPGAHLSPGVRSLEALVPFFGPRLGTAIRVITRDASSPQFQAILQDLFNANAGSSRSFKEFTAEGIPGVRNLQHATQKLLFGIPKGRGISGWDLRMRVTLEEIRRAVEGNADPQRMREFANQIGQYTSKPDAWIQQLRKVNPYMATTGPMRITELKQLVGTSGLKPKTRQQALMLQAETLMRGTGGTIVAYFIANKLLSGHWPGDNAPGHRLDIEMPWKNADDEPVYWSMTNFAPTVGRPARVLSINSLDREWNGPQGDKTSMVSAGLLGPANEALSLANSPLVGAGMGMLSGKALNFVKTSNEAPQLLDIVGKHGLTGSRGLDQILAGITQINPLPHNVLDYIMQDEKKALPFPLNVMEGVIPGKQFSTSYEKPSTGGGIAQPTRSRGRTRSRSRR